MPTATLTLELPRLPNFIRVKELDKYMDVADLSHEDLSALADDLKLALLRHAEQRRENREKP